MLDPLNTNVRVNQSPGMSPSETKVAEVAPVQRMDADLNSPRQERTAPAGEGPPAVKLDISEEARRLASAAGQNEVGMERPSQEASSNDVADVAVGQNNDQLGMTKDAGLPVEA